MRFYLGGPRVFGIRTGILLGPEDFRSAARARTGNMEGCFVYVVRGGHNCAKIGVTTNPSARIAALRTGSPFAIDYAFIGATTGNGFDIEREAHALLGRQRLEGEWFDVPPELAISALTGAAAKTGHPVQPVTLEQADEVIRIANSAEEPQRKRKRPLMAAVAVWLAVAVLVAIIATQIT